MTIANVQSARPANRRFRTAAAGVVRSTALAVTLGSGLPAIAAEADIDRREGVPADASPARDDIGGVTPGRQAAKDADFSSGRAAARSGPEDAIRGRIRPDMAPRLFAQFQLPAPAKEGEAPKLQLQRQLTYQYFVGTDPEMVYTKNLDLDNRLADKSITWLPSVSGIFTYRPTDWLETTVELQAEKEFVVHQERVLTLPNGTVELAAPRHTSFLVDQFHFTLKGFTAPFEISFGRKGFEDERRSLLDSSMDAVSVLLRQGRFAGLALLGRMARWSWDAAPHSTQDRDRIDTFYSYGDYRASDDVKLAAYGILRHDRDPLTTEGTPITMGMRVFGTPSPDVNYWADIAYQGGHDELARQINARQYDFGVTRRFFDVPLNPSLTLGWAMGSGDANPDDRKNNKFRPTTLGSNERRFAGIPQFKVFGEVLDPELSNVKIFTVGLGIKPDPQFSVDVVWHGYRLHKVQDAFESALTAEPNQIDSHLSKDLGTEWDIVLGFRNFVGVRRLTLDFRMGWFRPGKAYLKNDGTDTAPILRNPDRAVSSIFIIEYRFL
jgi:hypothetical protein